MKLRPRKITGGSLTVPGDKSIAHRVALCSILAGEPIRVTGFPDNADCQTSLACARMFGVKVTSDGDGMTLTPPSKPMLPDHTILECNNSGTTTRLLAGMVAGCDGISAIFTGDSSLNKRPMKRIADPLTEMGAKVFTDNGHLPMTVVGQKLLPFEYTPPMASAQVKSAVILAGLASGCSVSVREKTVTRDHTERLLKYLKSDAITVRDIKPVPEPDPHDPRKKRMVMPEDFKREIVLSSGAKLGGGEVHIPGDISTAAFFWALGALSGHAVTVKGVGVNPTRTAFLDHLKAIGCEVAIDNKSERCGEPVADVTVRGEKLRARKISGAATVGLIDEIPIVAVIASLANGTTVIKDAEELRHKESDRIAATAENLERMGVKVGVLEDGLAIEGKNELAGADLVSHGDHRIAMAMSIAATVAVGPSKLDDPDAVAVSCPDFFERLETLLR